MTAPLEFRATMDPDSLEVLRGTRGIANIQRHKDRPPRVVTWTAVEFTLDEMMQMVTRLGEFVTGSRR